MKIDDKQYTYNDVATPTDNMGMAFYKNSPTIYKSQPFIPLEPIISLLGGKITLDKSDYSMNKWIVVVRFSPEPSYGATNPEYLRYMYFNKTYNLDDKSSINVKNAVVKSGLITYELKNLTDTKIDRKHFMIFDSGNFVSEEAISATEGTIFPKESISKNINYKLPTYKGRITIQLRSSGSPKVLDNAAPSWCIYDPDDK